MLKKIFALLFFMLFGAASVSKVLSTSSPQDLTAFKNNSCVNCHSRAEGAASQGSRYYEWHLSAHKIAEVGCDKCHGGNASVSDKRQAHVGVLAAKEADSKVNAKHLPETCSSCHQPIATAFVSSKHYQKLNSAGMGPSCNTCHAHMGSEIIYAVEDIAKLCSNCHDSASSLMARKSELTAKTVDALNALRRAGGVVSWADGLIRDGQNKKVNVSAEEDKMKNVRLMLKDAKAGWHSFNLDETRKKADAAFEAGSKVKDALRHRLYPQ